MSKKEKKLLLRIIIAGIIFAVGMPAHHMGLIPENIEFFVFIVPYFIIGGDIIWRAVRNITRGQVFDENFLMSVATVGAFILGEYPEGLAVMLFYQVGEFFQSYAVAKSRRNISELMDIRPDYANVLRDGSYVSVDPDEVMVGDTISIRPGERVPLDGIVIEGVSLLDTAALTGESVPRDVIEGDEVLSGCINQSGRLTVRVTKEYGESTVAKILDMVENASSKKSRSEAFITRFARYYTPFVVFAALALALVMPLVTGQAFSVWVYRALTFLVISCPCALVISVPLSFFGGIGGASKSGVLVKGSNYLEALADTEIVVFDKTGTLTKGSFAVSKINAVGVSEKELLEYAALAEDYSTHPIAASIKRAYAKPVDTSRIGAVEEIPGHGVKAAIDGHEVLAGNIKLMSKEQIDFSNPDGAGTFVFIAVDKKYAGYICIEDEVKSDAKQAIAALKASGIRQTVMLTGDNDAAGQKVARELGLDHAYTELLPADKVEHIEELMAGKSAKGKLAFVGDGINDAPVLARADIGIAMGGLGSDAAIEAADVVIMTDEPSKIATVMQISKKTLRIVRQNIVFALGVKGIVLAMGAVGMASMWAAVFADVGVSVIAILNAMRALNVEGIKA